MSQFLDRADAGRQLARALAEWRGRDLVVLGLPRGGVVVAYEVAVELGAPLDVIVVRKVGVPFQPELAMGAIGEDGVVVTDEAIRAVTGVSVSQFDEVERRERVELERRVRRYRGDRTAEPIHGRAVIIVDDGMATGSTARAACQVARARGARVIVLAVPVAAVSTMEAFQGVADEVVAVTAARDLHAVGQWYRDFAPTSDEEVVRCLELARARHPVPAPATESVEGRDVLIPVDDVVLPGRLTIPARARGVVIFAHGSGSSRHSPRNRTVAESLQRAGIGTLLFDLLTEPEEADRRNVFDVELLARRLRGATRWLVAELGSRVSIGYFGASTGAAAALIAAASPDSPVCAIVSRGGRVDLAGDYVSLVGVPTLLIVGGEDRDVLELNATVLTRLSGDRSLEVIEGASHLFSEPGAMEEVTSLATSFFADHVGVAHTAHRAEVDR